MIWIALLGLLQEPAVSDLIRSLDDDDIVVRRKAEDELLRRGRSVEPELRGALLEGRSMEASLTLENMLLKLWMRESADRRPVVVRTETVTDERRFRRMKDDPPQVDFDR